MSRRISLALIVLWSGFAPSATIWIGYEHKFLKPRDVDHADPTYHDRITSGISLTRGPVEGIFNVEQEESYTSSSPADTLWAFPANNPDVALTDINAADWESLEFGIWANAIRNNPPSTIGQNAVLHLVSADTYLDIRLTDWSERSGGGVGYVRASAPESLDCNGDGLVSFTDTNCMTSARRLTEILAELRLPLGDLNSDSRVDFVDFLTLSQNFGTHGNYLMGDLDLDRSVKFSDFLLLADNFEVDRIVVTVPEPRIAAHWALGLFLLPLRGTRLIHSRFANRD